eukprot:gene13346-19187_t
MWLQQAMLKGKHFFGSIPKLGIDPLDIHMYCEANLQQLIVERDKGVGQSWDFTRLAMNCPFTEKPVSLFVVTVRNVDGRSRSRVGAQPLIVALWLTSRCNALALHTFLLEFESRVTNLKGGKRKVIPPWVLADCALAELLAGIRTYCPSMQTIAKYTAVAALVCVTTAGETLPTGPFSFELPANLLPANTRAALGLSTDPSSSPLDEAPEDYSTCAEDDPKIGLVSHYM